MREAEIRPGFSLEFAESLVDRLEMTEGGTTKDRYQMEVLYHHPLWYW